MTLTEQRPPPAQDAQRLRCFIVEDSPVILRDLKDTLQQMAPVDVVGSATDELSAIGWLDTHQGECDVLIVDMLLKNGTGLGVLEHLQRQGHAPQHKVVLTNYAVPVIRYRCSELGATQVFDKSSELESLINYCAALTQG